jgi:putative transposase
MPQALAQVYLHIIFSTKNRQPLLHDPGIREEMHKYLAGTCNNLDCPTLQVGGIADHVHLLCRFGRSISIKDLIKGLKIESSKWVKGKAAELQDFYWQNGYGVFSVSPGHVEPLREYIRNQETHHKTESFQDEFRRLLRIYGIAWDERFVWD